eukprot:1398331-Alexandrium_andersonii.AAC.1
MRRRTDAQTHRHTDTQTQRQQTTATTAAAENGSSSRSKHTFLVEREGAGRQHPKQRYPNAAAMLVKQRQR